MTEPEEIVVEPRVVPINGRPVTLKMLTDGQMAVLLRDSRILSSDSRTKEQALDSFARLDRVLRNLVAFDEDKAYVDELIIDGKLTLKELTRLAMDAFKEQEEQEKPKVRRGRPPAKRS